ncbi:MAG: PAS domain-containing protein [Scytonematopsis contorta HA4267-MV1]|jgi:PAS domain S-box-containing protein|nr:PAS domain-containing protein [Scytonematopsis contorta HA4267-MV1]
MIKHELTVLIVDGSRKSRENYRQYIAEDTSYTSIIYEEESGKKALELSQIIKPNAILVELELPDINALEFITLLKSYNIEKIPSVIVLIDKKNYSVAVSAMKSGACDCLFKEEITPELLRHTVHSAITNASLRRELQRSEERLRLSLEAAQMATWEWDLITDKVWLSPNFVTLFGLEPGMFAETAEAWLEKVHPEDREKVKNRIAQQRIQQNDSSQEYRLLLNEKIYWVCSQSRVILDASNSPIRMVGTIHDITERKQTQKKLQDSQRFIQQIAETVPGLIYVYDLIEQRNVYINSQAIGMLGYTPELMISMGEEAISQLMHPSDRLEIVKHWQRLKSAADEEVFTFEYRMRHMNGEWRWFCSRDKVYKRTPLGLPHQIIGNAQDITERKQMEEALKLTQERFQLATTAVNCIVYDWDIQSNTVERSEGIIEQLGYTQEEALPTPEWWRSIIHPDDIKEPIKESQFDLPSGNLNSMEYRLCHKYEKRYIWVRDTAFVVRDKDDNLLRVVGITIDINDIKQTEIKFQESAEQVRLATTAAELGMWFWDITVDELVWTEKCKALFGLSPDTKMSYELFLNCLHSEDRQRTHEAVTRCLEEKVDYDIEYRSVWSDGSVHWIAAKGRSFYDAEDKPIKMMGTAQNITERKELELERKRLLELEQIARTQAENANRAKDNFVAMVSHDLRAPLNSILGWTRLLKAGKVDQKATTRALEIIERSAKSQSRLIEDLLDVSRMIQGQLQLVLTPVSLITVIEYAIEQITTVAADKQIHVESKIDETVGLISGDLNRLQQILSNILSNAVKFTPSGGRIEICLECLGSDAQIRVIDTGKGMSSEFLPYVFERFRQEENSTARAVNQGLGLGLAIVRHLVEQHGGTISAESPGEGLGSTFIVRLPLIR